MPRLVGPGDTVAFLIDDDVERTVSAGVVKLRLVGSQATEDAQDDATAALAAAAAAQVDATQALSDAADAQADADTATTAAATAQTAANKDVYTGSFTTIVSATAQKIYVVMLYAGALTSLQLSANVATAGGSLVVTATKVGSGAVTGGVLTRNSGVGAGAATSATPSGANASFSAGDVYEFAISGGNTADGLATISIAATRT